MKLSEPAALTPVVRSEMRCPECHTYIGDMEWGDVLVVCSRSDCHKVLHFKLEKGEQENARGQ